MTRVNWTFLFLFTVIATFHNAKAELCLSQESFDLSPEPFSQSAAVDVELYNNGDHEINILSLSSTCGCTVPSLDKFKLNPGDRSKLKASVIFGYRQGDHFKEIVIETDETENPIRRIGLKIHIPYVLKWSPEKVDFSKLRTSKVKLILTLDNLARLHFVGARVLKDGIYVGINDFRVDSEKTQVVLGVWKGLQPISDPTSIAVDFVSDEGEKRTFLIPVAGKT